jgi:hypothetical protein
MLCEVHSQLAKMLREKQSLEETSTASKFIPDSSPSDLIGCSMNSRKEMAAR